MRRSQLMEIAALAAPMVVLGLTRLVMTPVSGDAGTGPSQGAPPILPVNAVAARVTMEQRRAAEWARSLDLTAALASPMDHPVIVPPRPAPVVQKPETPAPTPVAAPRVTQDPLTNLTLSATTKGRDSGGLALINGKVYRIGEDVLPGYRLESVDTNLNQVELRFPDGRQRTLGRKR
jgi:hypothetical protein